jgi:deoxyguanosine kinase
MSASSASEPAGRPFIAVEGPIGVGKTTLARLLHRAWGGALLLEQFDENPFLPLFYADRERYAWQTQLHFLTARFDQLTDAPGTAALLVSDYLFEKDLVFAQLNLGERDQRRHRKVFDALSRAVPQPTGVVFLQADLATLLGRIAARARPYERQINPGYLDALRAAYDAFFGGYAGAPLLRVDASAADFEHSPADRARLLARIAAAFTLPPPDERAAQTVYHYPMDSHEQRRQE